MLIWTPSKPILFASSTASGLPSSLRFQSVTPTLNFTPFLAAYASRRSRGQRAAAATPLPSIRRLSRRVRLMDRLLVERWLILGQANAGQAARSAEDGALQVTEDLRARAVLIAVGPELVAIHQAGDVGLGQHGIGDGTGLGQ